MSRKRTLMPEVYKNKKRICTGATNDTNSAWDNAETLGKANYCYKKTKSETYFLMYFVIQFLQCH